MADFGRELAPTLSLDIGCDGSHDESCNITHRSSLGCREVAGIVCEGLPSEHYVGSCSGPEDKSSLMVLRFLFYAYHTFGPSYCKYSDVNLLQLTACLMELTSALSAVDQPIVQ